VIDCYLLHVYVNSDQLDMKLNSTSKATKDKKKGSSSCQRVRTLCKKSAAYNATKVNTTAADGGTACQNDGVTEISSLEVVNTSPVNAMVVADGSTAASHSKNVAVRKMCGTATTEAKTPV